MAIIDNYISKNEVANLIGKDITVIDAHGNSIKLDIENPIIRINTAFKGCSSLEKISVLPRIYHN